MKIYTKTGDAGTTSLFGGKRVSKADLRIDAYGTVDELNAWMGVVRDQEANAGRKQVLLLIQDRLFVIGSQLATEPGNIKVKIPHLNDDDTAFLEKEIDAMQASLPPLRSFILPGGHTAVSFCHLARTVCRRAERLVIRLHETEPVNPHVITFLNRLSDYLFMLSRIISHDLHVEESPWLPKKV